MKLVTKRSMLVAGILTLWLAAPVMAANAEIGIVRQRMTDSLLPVSADAQAAILHAADLAAKSMKADGSWGDIDYTDRARSDNWKSVPHMDRTQIMAKACEINRRNNTPDGAMTAKTLRAFDWWLTNDPKNPNWWWNEIGVPKFMGETMLLMRSEASPDETAKAIAIMKRSKWDRWTGQNLVWGCVNEVMRGCIENDAAAVGQGYARMFEEVVIEPREKEGIQADFSFHQHGKQLYSGGYGQGFARDATRFTSFSWGTKWQIPQNALESLNLYILDGEQWMTHYSRFDFSAMGREITREGVYDLKSETSKPIAPADAVYTLLNSVDMVSKLPVPRQAEWKQFAKRLADDRTAVEPLVGNRMFWCSDYMAHHRPEWFASIKMFSTRMQNTELVNDEGKKSHHLADGAMLLYLTGSEYTDIFPVWDWCRIPGTTAEQVEDLNKWESGGNHIKGKTNFVGGVSDGADGVAAMDLKRGKLSAHKTYICLDDGVLCLGAGISCDTDNDVVTEVNQCHLSGEVQKADDLSWVSHAGVIYQFPGKQHVTLSTATRSGRWRDLGNGSDVTEEQPVFNLSIDHGKHVIDGAYVYYVQVGGEKKQLPVDVLSNTSSVQMVESPDKNLAAAVFWQATKLGNLEADRPCVVLVRNGMVNVSDPTEKLDSVNVRVKGVPYHIDLPKGAGAGSSVSVKLKPVVLDGL